MSGKYLKEGLDYQFLDDIDIYPSTPVKILTGVYKDIEVCFGKVKIVETEENGEGILGFTYMIVSPKDKKIELDGDSNFKNFLGSILDSVIIDSLEARSIENEVVDEDRESNFTQSDDRSRIWKESNTIS